ncbi:MAG: ATP-dependent zinc protease [Bacteroidia bacterium]|nr:ATP-dependent zinc protease [Bacteroidia bacterium]
MSSERTKQVLGKREYVDFPDLDLFGINAKIDTGAYTTALHCHGVRLKKAGEKELLCFTPLGKGEDAGAREFCVTEFHTKLVRNSFGDSEERYMIKTRIRIGRKTIRALISLSDRSGMRYPVLIGRKLLKKRFLVDVELEHAGRKLKKKKSRL